MTGGVQLVFHKSCWLSLGSAIPLSGPKPFDFEFIAQLELPLLSGANSAMLRRAVPGHRGRSLRFRECRYGEATNLEKHPRSNGSSD